MRLIKLLLHGPSGHPIHPPLTDATIGMFTLAAALAVLGKAGVAEGKLGPATWLALAGGLIVASMTATTGFADWLQIGWGTPMWKTATWHLAAMVTAVGLFAIAAWLQWSGYRHGSVTSGGLIFTLAGFVFLTAGGWLGGAIVFVHGMRVEADTKTTEED